MYARDRFPDTKKAVFRPGQCRGVIATERRRNRRIGGLSLAPKIPQIVEGLEGHRMTDHPLLEGRRGRNADQANVTSRSRLFSKSWHEFAKQRASWKISLS
jgi:hypothetical protein